MNQHLIIPAAIKSILNDIENMHLYLAELPMPEHPKYSNYNRTIRVIDIDAKSKNEFLQFTYEQVLKDKETGEVDLNIKLPTPQWVVYKDTWSYFRDEKNVAIQVPTKEDNAITERIIVPTYKYMIWLMANDKASFLDLIKGYLADFSTAKIEELNGQYGV